MASQNNFFALLGDDENDDPALLIARAASLKTSHKPMDAPGSKQKQQQQLKQELPAKLPSRPLPPHQAVREAQQSQLDGGSGRGIRGARGGRSNFGVSRGRGRENAFQGGRISLQDQNFDINRGDSNQAENKDFYNNSGAYGDFLKHDGGGGRSFDGERGRGRGRGRARGYFYGADSEDISQRDFDRRSGTGQGNDLKRDDAGRWGAEGDQGELQNTADVNPLKEVIEEKKVEETLTTEPSNIEEDKKAEEEEIEMSLDEYEKVLSERRKALEAFKPEQRKVVIDKDFESMQLVDKKQDDTGVLKMVPDIEKGKKKMFEKEKGKKSVSINEFLKPPEGEEYYSRRGRGRGRGDRGGFRGGFRGVFNANIAEEAFAPSIEDPKQFPTLSGT